MAEPDAPRAVRTRRSAGSGRAGSVEPHKGDVASIAVERRIRVGAGDTAAPTSTGTRGQRGAAGIEPQTAARQAQGPEDDPVALADAMQPQTPERTTSPRADDMQGAAGPSAHDATLDGQLGPDEISEPEEIVMNNEAKAHR